MSETCARCDRQMVSTTRLRNGNIVTHVKCTNCGHGYVVGKPAESYAEI